MSSINFNRSPDFLVLRTFLPEYLWLTVSTERFSQYTLQTVIIQEQSEVGASEKSLKLTAVPALALIYPTVPTVKKDPKYLARFYKSIVVQQPGLSKS